MEITTPKTDKEETVGSVRVVEAKKWSWIKWALCLLLLVVGVVVAIISTMGSTQPNDLGKYLSVTSL